MYVYIHVRSVTTTVGFERVCFAIIRDYLRLMLHTTTDANHVVTPPAGCHGYVCANVQQRQYATSIIAVMCRVAI